MEDEDYIPRMRRFIHERSLIEACADIWHELRRSVSDSNAYFSGYCQMKEDMVEPEVLSLFPRIADQRLTISLRIIDEIFRQELIGTRIAPLIEAMPPAPLPVPEYNRDPADVVFLGWHVEAQITRWRRQVREAPTIDACVLVVRVLTDNVQKLRGLLEPYLVAVDIPPVAERRAFHFQVTGIQYGLILRLIDDVLGCDLMRAHFEHYFQHDPGSIEYRNLHPSAYS